MVDPDDRPRVLCQENLENIRRDFLEHGEICDDAVLRCQRCRDVTSCDECLLSFKITKTDAFRDYISKNNLGELLSDLESFLNDGFGIRGRFKDLSLELVAMKVFVDPEDGSVEPEIDMHITDKGSINDTEFLIDLEEEVKRYFAKRSKDVEDFKKKVLNFRRFRMIIKEGR